MNAIQAASLALLAFGATEFFLRRGGAAKSVQRTESDKGTTPLLLGCYALVVCLLFVPRLPGPRLPAVVASIGVAMAFAGLAFRWWSMIVLGRFYTRTLTTASDQSVVTRGPYHWIRHPGYLGSLMTWVGAAAALQNPVLLLVVIAMLLFAYGRRITAEESMLAAKLGAPYVAYQQRSWRLMPFLF